MIDIKEIFQSLPGNVLANLIAAAITAFLALLIGRRGKQAGEAKNIELSGGQYIYVDTNQGSIVTQNTNTSNINKNTIHNYGNQRSSGQPDDEVVLYGILAIIGLGILLVVAKFVLSAITTLPLYLGGTATLVGGFFLCARRAHYTTVALRKAVSVNIVLLVTSFAAFCTMNQTQDLTNPYSVLAISEKAMSAPGGEKILTGAIPRFLYLASNGNQEYVFAFLLSLFAIIISWLICIYYLKIALGSLLFPASSNGKTFVRFISSLNDDFVKIHYSGIFLALSVSGLMVWLTAPGSFELIVSWFESWQNWLAGVLESL